MFNALTTSYVRFLELRRAIEDRGDDSLTANQKALLEMTVLAWHSGQPMSVRQAIQIHTLGSPATLHKRLTFLRNHGYIFDQPIEGDRRTKLLVPTQKTLELFEQLGSAMQIEAKLA